jgi:plasmid stabilization system protein ParE
MRGGAAGPALRVRYSARAARELRAIHAYIARDDARAADRWIDKLLAAAELAAVNPRAGRVVPEWDDEAIREVFVRTYRVIYRVAGRRLFVLTVLEGRKRLAPGRIKPRRRG